MDRLTESRCLALTENYAALAAGNKMEFQEMTLACAGLFLAEGKSPDPVRLDECRKLLKSKAGVFSNFRGSDELLVRSKMALADDPAQYFDDLQKQYGAIKSFFSGEQTVLAAMILAEHGASVEGAAEKMQQIYKQMKGAHPWLTSENDLPFAALMAVSGKDPAAVHAEAEEIYSLLRDRLRADRDTQQMISHILAIRDGRAENKCEKLCALAEGLKAAGHPLGRSSRLAILGLLADSGLPADALVERICEADDFLKQHKPFKGIFGVGRDCRRMFAAQMVQSSLSGEAGSAAAMMTASVELAIITMILMMIIVSTTASVNSASH